jgi:hypothetical protein
LSRGLDHIVHAVRSLDAGRDLYERLGFTVGARNRHPASWGTQNQIIQLPDFFVELLSISEPDGIAAHGPRTFSFGAFNRDFLGHTEGLSMLALESKDARADADGFRAAGIGDFEIVDFEREARRPDGTGVKVGFSLAFARDDRAPAAAFFACQQHYPENFWNPAFQDHPNTTERVAAIVMVADNPTDHHIFLSAFVGERALTATSSGISVHTPHGDIQVMDPTAFASHFGVEAPDISGGARLAAIIFGVRNFSAAIASLQKAEIAASVRMGRIIVAPASAMGSTIVFQQN